MAWHGWPSVFQDSVKIMAPRCWVKSPNGFSIFLRPPSDDTQHIHPCGPHPSSARTLFHSRHRQRRHYRCSRRRRRYQRHRAISRCRRRYPRVAAAATAAAGLPLPLLVDCCLLFVSNAVAVVAAAAAAAAVAVDAPTAVVVVTTPAAVTVDVVVAAITSVATLSWKCCQHVATCRHDTTVSLQFWPDGSVSPTQN